MRHDDIDINAELLAGVREAEAARGRPAPDSPADRAGREVHRAADMVARLTVEVARLTAERDALVRAARHLVDWYDHTDGDMGESGDDAIERLAALLPPAAGEARP